MAVCSPIGSHRRIPRARPSRPPSSRLAGVAAQRPPVFPSQFSTTLVVQKCGCIRNRTLMKALQQLTASLEIWEGDLRRYTRPGRVPSVVYE